MLLRAGIKEKLKRIFCGSACAVRSLLVGANVVRSSSPGPAHPDTDTDQRHRAALVSLFFSLFHFLDVPLHAHIRPSRSALIWFTILDPWSGSTYLPCSSFVPFQSVRGPLDNNNNNNSKSRFIIHLDFATRRSPTSKNQNSTIVYFNSISC